MNAIGICSAVWQSTYQESLHSSPLGQDSGSAEGGCVAATVLSLK